MPAGRAVRLGLLLLVYVALAMGFARATPPLEASDEARHLGFVVFLARNGALPVADAARPGLAAQEALQPPLYYALGAGLVRGLRLRDARRLYDPMPGSTIGRADLPGPRRMFLPPAQPTGGQTIAAVRRLRLFSIALGVLTVLCTWAAVRALSPDDPDGALFAGALVALNPMFLFIGSSVNNDALVTALSAACVLVSCRPGFAPVRTRSAVAAGLAVGVAFLAKASAAILVPPLLYRIALAAPDRRAARRAAALALGAATLAAGWWVVRNVVLYGEPLATTLQARLAGNLRPSWQPLALLREWDGFVKSFWGVFGGFNVIYPDGVYHGFFVLTALGAASTLVLLVRPGVGRDPRVRALALLVACNLLAVAAWTSRLLGSQGRLMFPSLPAIAVLAALSVAAWPPRARRAVRVTVTLYLLATAAWACLVLIPDAYATP